MKYLHPYKDFLLETIRASEAHRDEDAVQTVIDGKRDLGFIAVKTSTMPEEQFWQAIEDNGLKTIRVEGNIYEAYVYFRPEAIDQALELKAIAEKYAGYLRWDATEEDSRRIGELLGYAKEDIDWYIAKNYPNETP